MAGFHDFTMQTIDGGQRSLADFRDRVLLVVNVASRCGLTPQYAGLQKLHDELAPRGFSVVGFPCNQFGGQEPGTEAEVKQFCETSFGVTFPLFAKVDVNGPKRAPVYAWLTGQATSPDGPGDIQWNFAKFVVDRSGNVAARFDPTTGPDSAELRGAIDRALA